MTKTEQKARDARLGQFVREFLTSNKHHRIDSIDVTPMRLRLTRNADGTVIIDDLEQIAAARRQECN